MTLSGFRLFPCKLFRSLCATVTATGHKNILGKLRLTGNPVGLAAWQHFYMLLDLH